MALAHSSASAARAPRRRFLPARRATPGPKHHFFGYYDKTPWDATGRYLLALEVSFIDRPPRPEDAVTVGMVDLAQQRFIPLAQTTAWCWQQGTMLQWLGSAPDRLIVYNSREGDRYISVVHDVHSGARRTLPRPIYALSRDGRWALSINFARLADTRPGYGYVGLPDPWADQFAPDDDGIWLMDMESGNCRLIISYAQVANFRPDPTMEQTKHWFNHLEWNTDGSRFSFLHRWRPRGERRWKTRLLTANPDGSELFCLAAHDMVSHYDWRDAEHILAWARHPKAGDRYYLFRDRAAEVQVVAEGVLTVDGHCSYSPDRTWILTDTYPDREHMRTLILYHPARNQRIDIGRFFSPPQLSGEIRCDLHPRWNRDGTQVCIDSAHEGERQMYIIDVSEIVAGG